LVAAYIAAAVKARVSLIEKHRMGGDCLNTGCVPSKALIRSARFLGDVARAQALGFRKTTAEFDFAEIMARVRRVVRTVEPHDSVERYTRLGVECVEGAARITSPWTVEVDGRQIATRAIVVATGARPFVPPIPGLREAGFLTSDTVWELTALPRRLVVLGGGPIGCELAQCFARFGAEVTVVEVLPRLLPREDEEIAALVEARFRHEGIRLLTGHRAAGCRAEGGRKILVCEREGATTEIECDEILVAVGRAANTTGFGLEELGIPRTKAGTIEVNEYLQTRIPTIFACGDVVGPYQFTHAASHQAWFAAVNALFGGVRKFRVDYSVIPWCTFTDPEVARVGLNELEARERGVPYEVTRYGVDDLDRAIADEAAEGVVKVLTVPGKDRILGATIVAAHAGELITEFVSAMKHSIGLGKILGTIHIYPTMSEANKYAAGAWKRAHTSDRTLRLLERFHGWLLR
jgi:pyruvate/2-oxoglutarate dehydrogenase complex dihydrolipoamide dehydrogenase (E3) component